MVWGLCNGLGAESRIYDTSTSKKDGSGFYTDGFTLTMEALYATNATYTTSDGKSGSFATTKDITIGTGLKVGEKVTVTIKANNDLGSVTKTFTYIKKEGSNAIYFKNTNNWSDVTAYAWKNETVKNAAWPGASMECIDAENQIFMVELDQDAGYTKIIFSNNGASQTADLDIPELGYIYTGSGWEEYEETKSGWQQAGTYLYYYDSNGKMVTGWQKISGKWYYLNDSGVMQTGWIKLNGKWYYLKSSGEMISGEKVTIGGKNYTFNSNGVWIK